MTSATRTVLTARAVDVRQRSANTLSDELRRRIVARSPDPTVWDEVEPFVWAAQISSDVLDSYYTRMHLSSLKNYATDATAGVSFLPSHNKRHLPIGASLDGVLSGNAVTATFFTVPGLRLPDIDTDSLIASIRAGVVRDVSIGFQPGRFECSVCGQDMLDFSSPCVHIPGQKYGKGGKASASGDLAFAWVKDARLLEVSAVYDGATPGAQIIAVLKERVAREIGSGRVDRQEALVLVRSISRLAERPAAPVGSATRTAPPLVDQARFVIGRSHR